MGITTIPAPTASTGRRVVVSTSTSYTAAVNTYVEADAVGGPLTVTLPAAPVAGDTVAVKKVDASTNAVTVVGQGGATIEGDANATIVTKGSSIDLIYVGVSEGLPRWKILAAYREGTESGSPANTHGFRNVIRNGDVGVAQRGTGPFTTFDYTLDGWMFNPNGGTASLSRIAAPIGTGLGEAGAVYAMQIAVSGQSANGHYVQLAAKIEGVRTLAGQQVTASFRARATTGTPKIGVEIVQNFGTPGGSGQVNTPIQAVTLSTTATRYSVTFTVPSIVGKSIGTNNNDYLQLTLWLSAGSDFATRASSIGLQADTFEITDVQLEPGAEASPFERLPQQQQLDWCQRYYIRYGPYTLAGRTMFMGQATNTDRGFFYITFPVVMRADPAVARSASTDFQSTNPAGTGQAITALGTSGNSLTREGVRINWTNTSYTGYTAGQAAMLVFSAAGAWLSFGAEL